MSEAHPARSRLLVALWLTAAVAGLAGTAAAVRHRLAASPPLPVLANLPSFALVDSAGQPLDPRRLAGRPYVADFIFTRCAGVCPSMTGRLARLRPEIPGAVRFVSFTVDPLHDTPAVLLAYARAHGAGDDWLFVTGTREALHALAVSGFKLAAAEVPPEEQMAGGDGPFLHSSRFVLVDGRGRVRGYYDSADEAAVKALQRDARALLDAPS